jgi:hypothetical protein
MSYLAVDLALFELLTGAPLDSEGRPRLGDDGLPVNRNSVRGPEKGGGLAPSWGIRIPMLKHPQHASPGLSTKRPDAVRPFSLGFTPNAYKWVPVFNENVEGRAWEDVWPCVTFRYLDADFDGSVSPYHDPFQEPYGAKVDLKNQHGEVVQSGQTQVKVRRHPEAWPVTYQVRVWTKNGTELHLIEKAVRTLFTARGVLFVPQADGARLPFDMLFTGYENLDQMGNEVKMVAGQEQRYLSRAFNYQIEAYEDNTTNEFGTNDVSYETVVYQRILEMQQLMGQMAVESWGNVNLVQNVSSP